MRERVLIVGVSKPGGVAEEKELMRELSLLVESAGGEVVSSAVQNRRNFDPATVVGTGKLQELKELIERVDAELVVFNLALTGGQKRNLERFLGVRVIDRVELIMDIFAQHARTKEAKLQVMWAQLSYRLSRLRGMGSEMSRLGGGIGTRGPGEQKLEVDRRAIRRRLSHISKELKEIECRRDLQRKNRSKFGNPMVSLVGYTNSGKSTLLAALSRADVYVADKLFSTLDPLTRRVYVGEGRYILLSDTVGFIRRLPPNLISAFKATLEELRYADLLLEVIDASVENVEEYMDAVERVLKELDLLDKERWIVFNKIDLLDGETVRNLVSRYPGSIAISALKGYNLDVLKGKLLKRFFLSHIGGMMFEHTEHDRV